MSLKNFEIARKEVSYRGQALQVRGFSLNDISMTMREYLPELGKLFDMYGVDEQRDNALQESAKFAITIVRESPMLVAQMIVLAADDDNAESFDIALKLPITFQVEVLRAIFELTFEEAGGAKKFVDSLVATVKAQAPKPRQD